MTQKWTEADVTRVINRTSRRLPGAAPILERDSDGHPSRLLLGGAPTKSKYKNIRTTVDGLVFDSKAEAEYWLLLKAREKAGEIWELQRQIVFPLYAPVFDKEGTTSNGMHAEVARYVADYTWREGVDRHLVVCDCKGRRTRQYLLKRKWLAVQSGITITEVS